jgi:hypothetical protein
MINFRALQKNLKCQYVNVVLKGEKTRIELSIDRGGRIIDCTRVGRLFDRIQGRQLLSVMNGVNNQVIDEINDEVNIINGLHFIPTI